MAAIPFTGAANALPIRVGPKVAARTKAMKIGLRMAKSSVCFCHRSSPVVGWSDISGEQLLKLTLHFVN
jgi:hypothetical protein